jgi:hypothetical protein
MSASYNNNSRASRDQEEGGFSGPGKQLMLVSLLANDRIISNNGKAFLKGL